MSVLHDPFGRQISYLRLSVTDRCDFRCTYCMSEDMVFAPHSHLLTLDELYQVASAFIGLGVRRIRLTGGEPLVRKHVLSLLTRLGQRRELEDLSITTNGSQLAEMAPLLRQAGVSRINVSLDSLNSELFAQFTRRDRLAQVLQGIEVAVQQGFKRVKINSVIQSGHNEHELVDLVRYAVSLGADISFIEEMPLGTISSHQRASTFCSSEQVRERLASEFQLIPSLLKTGGPSRYWRVQGTQTHVGFISPHSQNFCGSCNRVRVTAEGKLVLCLGHDGALDLRSIVRRYPNQIEPLQEAIIHALQLKPERHFFEQDTQVQVVRFMSVTGG